eukprot:scaffold17526_cov168-Skeletonema_marinoi.AAC.2
MDTVVHHAMMLEEVMPTKYAVLRPLLRAAARNVLMMQHLGWKTMQRHAQHRRAALKQIAMRMVGG